MIMFEIFFDSLVLWKGLRSSEIFSPKFPGLRNDPEKGLKIQKNQESQSIEKLIVHIPNDFRE